MIIKLICLCVIAVIAYFFGWYTGKNEEKSFLFPLGEVILVLCAFVILHS